MIIGNHLSTGHFNGMPERGLVESAAFTDHISGLTFHLEIVRK